MAEGIRATLILRSWSVAIAEQRHATDGVARAEDRFLLPSPDGEGRRPLQRLNQPQFVGEEPGQQKVLLDVLPPPFGERRRQIRIAEQLDEPLSTLLDAVNEEPTRPTTTGVPFQSASATTSPNPSRRDFWITTRDHRWNALTSRLPTPVRFVNTAISGGQRRASPSASAFDVTSSASVRAPTATASTRTTSP